MINAGMLIISIALSGLKKNISSSRIAKIQTIKAF